MADRDKTLDRLWEGTAQPDSGYSEFEAEGLRETPQALYCTAAGIGERWFPKSAIHDDSEVYAKGHSGKLRLMSWFVKSQRLDEESPRKRPMRVVLPAELDDAEQIMMSLLRAESPRVLRPSRALVALESRGLVRREGSGAETQWFLRCEP